MSTAKRITCATSAPISAICKTSMVTMVTMVERVGHSVRKRFSRRGRVAEGRYTWLRSASSRPINVISCSCAFDALVNGVRNLWTTLSNA
jgi:hypothetical protein